MQVDLNINGTLNGTGAINVAQNGTEWTDNHVTTNEPNNGVPKRKLNDENEDMPEKKLKLEDLKTVEKKMEVDTEDAKMDMDEEVKEEKITIEEIRRLKEILRQEDAKLQIIKK